MHVRKVLTVNMMHPGVGVNLHTVDMPCGPQTEESVVQKQPVCLSVLLVSGCIHNKVEAELHPVDALEKVANVNAGVNVECHEENVGYVAEEVAEADDADGGGHALVAGRQLGRNLTIKYNFAVNI
jgi:hypothetical protein